jgi:hypothetical protein
MRATCPIHLILIDLIALTKLGEAPHDYTSFHLGPNILPTLCSQTLSISFLPSVWRSKFHAH